MTGRGTVSEDTTGRAGLELSGHVLHEAIDDEVIVIDLTTGTYYSLRGSAAEVWGLLQRWPGTTGSELAEALVARYQPNGDDVEAAVMQFLGQLQEEGLVKVVEMGITSSALAPTGESSSQAARDFAAPLLEKYTDMQDLVLIDPVHEVDQRGWPHRPDAAADGSGG